MNTYKVEATFIDKDGNFTIFKDTITALNRYHAGHLAMLYIEKLWENMDKAERDTYEKVKIKVTDQYKHGYTYSVNSLKHYGIFF